MTVYRIAPAPMALFMASLYFVVGSIVGVMGVAIGLLRGDSTDQGLLGLGLWSLIFLPLMYAILGLMAGALLAVTYNVFAKVSGGLRFECETNSS